MYSKYCGVVSEKIDVCPNVGWIPDFGDPQAVLDVPFNGNLIVKNGTNSNWGLVNHPKINAAMEAAAKVVGVKARGEAWAKIDRELVEEAVAVPYQWAKEPYIESKDVEGVNRVLELGDLGLLVHLAEVAATGDRRERGRAAAPGDLARSALRGADRARRARKEPRRYR